MNVYEAQRACAKYRPLLDSYLSNELLVETTHEVLRHLEICGDCRQDLQAREQARDLLRGAINRIQAPQQLRIAVLARKAPPLRMPRRAGSWLAVAAGLLLAMVAGMGVERNLTHRGYAAALLDAGWKHHEHCALQGLFRGAPQQLSEADRWLLPAARQQLPGYEIAHVHTCMHDGRRFGHVVAERDNRLLSVALLRRQGPDSLMADLGTRQHGTGNVAGSVHDGWIVLVSGEQPAFELAHVAQGVRPNLVAN